MTKKSMDDKQDKIEKQRQLNVQLLNLESEIAKLRRQARLIEKEIADHWND